MAEPEKRVDRRIKFFGLIVGLVIFAVGVAIAFVAAFINAWDAADGQGHMSVRMFVGTGLFIVMATGALASYVTLQISRSNRLTIIVACLPWLLLLSLLLYVMIEGSIVKGILNPSG